MASGSYKIGIIGGAGWLGSAIAKSLIYSGVIGASEIVISSRSHRPASPDDIRHTPDNRELARLAEVVLLSVRPEDSHLVDVDVEGKLLISVMAGVSSELLSGRHRTQRVVRALPNAAAAVGLSYTPWFASSSTSEDDRDLVRAIFDACGTQDVLTREADIDFLTGLTGTGPAYPALLAVAMYRSALSHGLNENVAMRAVNGMLVGAGGLLREKPVHPELTVRDFVDYKGVTAAGLEAMQSGGFVEAVDQGIKAALQKTQAIARTIEQCRWSTTATMKKRERDYEKEDLPAER
ncbi:MULTISPECIES: pyrroline-5-carboxylate reductase dimerization domain-containing protein [Rhizobium/Agrobacterium group]|uniref:pyrroline-5-carboxylate reductase family protein n=1 Tax=Rhizobium/Agrobacterium group TaxID=227290 RepID=UPI001AD98689|nr:MULTISPECIES: pyrroline-5-carboxylate reductase dimerization domain-containing protein [Rhizobium/Agrobacterium group]MBO9112692.1 NAD(P)-binding domain-containing protein [Agrobacterium sp. S2/73]QXZ76182.1 NAD(P)-binding domain-containing protein [Agrobacterium sp. S7/73]QYA17269.1 NAD(P)-binding domain-containing protein [Rhizobium sp. AB2/73]UEQ85614.1 NAD(P)-binding domain-containing protein [Rhizobium sp. AB2/73]